MRFLNLMAAMLTATVALTPQLAQTAEPRRPIVLKDQTASDPSFAQFRQQLTRIVQARDAQGLTKLLPSEGLSIGFTRPTSIKDLNLKRPDARLWHILDYTLAHSCAKAQVGTNWICPTVAKDFLTQYPKPKGSMGIEYEVGQVIVLGKFVNVRSQPKLESPVIAQLTNEVVRNNPKATGSFDINNPQIGWQPVRLPDGRSGFVNNRYVYFPLGYHLSLEKTGNQWQITQILAGD
jgi:hypothetical protein